MIKKNISKVSGFLELSVFLLLLLLVYWYNQSTLPIVKFYEPPKVIIETQTYFEIQWHTKLLLPNCITFGYPVIYSEYGSEHLPAYSPLYSISQEQQFIRRYYIPEYLIKLNSNNKFEFRLTLKASCNPLWTNTQFIKIPFSIPKSE